MPPTPSSVADSDTLLEITDPLLAAAQVLVRRKLAGVIWLDRDLTVHSTAGRVDAGVVPGAPIADAMVALTGIEAELREMQAQSKASARMLHLPNTAVMGAGGVRSRRQNISIYWIDEYGKYLVLLGSMVTQASAAAELDQEIRRRRLVEQDLAAQTEEFARINQQLEEFAYVISHDLNAPLRALRHHSRDMQLALAAHGLPAERGLQIAREAAHSIETQTRRMSRMMVDLLEYARVGRAHEATARVDTGGLVREIADSLRQATTLELTVAGEWPTIETATAPLDLVLRNLIENAIKHHDRERGQVEVRAAVRGPSLVCEIADDGRGIAGEWQEAIFEPFRKIDDAHHPESSGIGLALVKKTLVNLGGRIEVVSDPQHVRGTTFVVYWPLKLPIIY